MTYSPSHQRNNRRKYKYRRKNEICVVCGKRKPREGYATCNVCLKKQVKYRKLRKMKWNTQSKH